MKKNVPLFQVYVTDTAVSQEIPIGPAMDNPEALYPFAEQVNLAVVKGRIHGWRDAHVLQVEAG
jgi:hypothetical protein